MSVFNCITNTSLILKLFIVLAFLCFPISSFSSEFDNVDFDKLTKSTKREIRYNIAAVDIFQELRKELGERLRVSGGLISCGYHDKAQKIKPTTFELLAYAFGIMETFDINSNGDIELTDKRRLSLARRVVTASTVYMMSGGDPIILVDNLIPNFKNRYCKVQLKSFERIYAKLPTDGYRVK